MGDQSGQATVGNITTIVNSTLEQGQTILGNPSLEQESFMITNSKMVQSIQTTHENQLSIKAIVLFSSLGGFVLGFYLGQILCFFRLFSH